MKYNFSHFLGKKRKSFAVFLEEMNIKTKEEFSNFLTANDFYDDKQFSDQITVKLVETPLETPVETVVEEKPEEPTPPPVTPRKKKATTQQES